jgi:hypothetical protein
MVNLRQEMMRMNSVMRRKTKKKIKKEKDKSYVTLEFYQNNKDNKLNRSLTNLIYQSLSTKK